MMYVQEKGEFYSIEQKWIYLNENNPELIIWNILFRSICISVAYTYIDVNQMQFVALLDL